MNNIICGIDPGLINTGWGIITSNQNKLSFIASGVIVTKSKDPMEDRLKEIFLNIKKIIELYNPDQ